MSPSSDLESLRAEALYYKDRVALLRAKLYRWGEGSSPRLRELEDKLALAERRLHAERTRLAGERLSARVTAEGACGDATDRPSRSSR